MKPEKKDPNQGKPAAPGQAAFDRQSVARELRPFMDDQGRLAQWPTKQKTQRMAVSYLAAKFEPSRIYNEKQVNELLNEWHTFGDWAMLRRLLFDWLYFDRESDGSKYWMRSKAEPPGRVPDSAATSPA
jgi:hypothetical protein